MPAFIVLQYVTVLIGKGLHQLTAAVATVFLRYPYFRGSGWCLRDVINITLWLAAESSTAALNQ
jgi:hypothetical protein